MDDATLMNWYLVAQAVARQAQIDFGNVTFRIENREPTGLIEIRQTIKLDHERAAPLLEAIMKNMEKGEQQ